MQIQIGKNQPPTGGMNPVAPAETVGDEGQEQGGEEDGGLRAQQFEMDQSTPADRRGEKKSDFSLGEGQRGPLMRHDPGQYDNNQQDERAKRFIKREILR